MFIERADAVISHISGQAMQKNWQQKQFKGGSQQRPQQQMKTSGESNAQGNAGPELMELGMAQRRMLSKEEYRQLQSRNACFYCRCPNVGHFARDCPLKKKKRQGNG